MKMKITLVLSCMFSFNLNAIAQFHPGGVPDSEVWFIADESDIINGNYTNNAGSGITINSCNQMQALPDLYNFNPSIFSENLCLQYRGILENSNGRDLFFVGERYAEPDENQSHFATEWIDQIGDVITLDQSTVPYTYYNLNTLNGWTNDVTNSYPNEFTSYLFSYHTNTYFIDKKYKSYGLNGETLFKIGDISDIPFYTQLDDGQFVGELPEFITYSREISVNERTRIESYLALKYGLTLHSNISYLNSGNKVFWNSANNGLFGHRIFGIGRDDVSNLNQLQSESSYLQGFLVTAVGVITNSNPEKQLTASVNNHNFLVYGDNGAVNVDFEIGLDNGTKTYSRVWLAQSTGTQMPLNNIHFELALTTAQVAFFESNPNYNIWLLRDPYENNLTVSDFNNSRVDYHLATIDLVAKKAIFSDVFFDADESKYDQFTFGMNDRLIVQATYRGCEGEEIFVDVKVYGCTEEMTIVIEGSNGYIVEFDVDRLPFTFSGEVGVEYTINVFCSTGSSGTTIINIEVPIINLDLGPDLELSTLQNSFLLDASSGVQDLEATYAWFEDGVRINHMLSTYEVTEPGIYTVEITSGNGACTVTDTVVITTQQLQVNTTIALCNGLNTNYAVTALSGTSPYSLELQHTSINGATVNSSYYTFNQTTNIDIYQYGNYTVIIEDAHGMIYTESFISEAPYVLTILNQLQDAIAPRILNLFNGRAGIFPLINRNYYSLNAALGLPHANFDYDWYINNNFYSSNPIISFAVDFDGGVPCDFFIENENVITLRVINRNTGCETKFNYYHQFYKMPTEGCGNEAGKSDIDAESEKPNIKSEIKTTVQPNPSETDVAFNYDITSSILLSGKVEVFSPNGQLLQTTTVTGTNSYSLPFSLYTSGVYVIKLTTSTGTIIVDRVVIR